MINIVYNIKNTRDGKIINVIYTVSCKENDCLNTYLLEEFEFCLSFLWNELKNGLRKSIHV